MTAPNPQHPDFDFDDLAYAEERRVAQIDLLLKAALMSEEGETRLLLHAVLNAIRENRTVHADREGAALAAFELDIASREYVGLLEDVALGGPKDD